VYEVDHTTFAAGALRRASFFALTKAAAQRPPPNLVLQVVGEYGGHGLALPGHLWAEGGGTAMAPNAAAAGAGNWGYGKLPKHASQLREMYRVIRRRAEAGVGCGQDA